MKRLLCIAAVGLSVVASGTTALAGPDSLHVGLSGQVQSISRTGPSDFQIGPAAYDSSGTVLVEGTPALNGPGGAITAYSAGSALPQVTPGTLSDYAFALYSTLTSVSNNVADYSGTFRIYAPGFGLSVNDGQILEHGTFTVQATFTSPFDATLSGVFLADTQTYDPPGVGPINYSPANPVYFSGEFTSSLNGPQFITGTLYTVPEPTGLTLVGLAVGGVAVRSLRKRRVR